MTREEAEQYLYYAMTIGEQLLCCGAEVGRVEDTIRRICLAYGATRADVFSITSSIVTTIYGEDFGICTQTRRVPGMSNDLGRLDDLNQLSRYICEYLIGIALKLFEAFVKKGALNSLLTVLLCCGAGGVLSNLTVLIGLGHHADLISIGNIMLLIPGIAFTNSLRDMFSGDTITGLIRCMEALLLALVVGLGFTVANLLF